MSALLDLTNSAINSAKFPGHLLADTVATYPLLFTVCHTILTLHSVKKEWVAANSKSNPLANYLLGLACCNAGGLITAFLTGNKTVLECLFFGKADPMTMGMYTLVWWMTFYCPKDFFCRVLMDPKSKRSSILMKVLLIGKELLRTKKIYTGVELGTKLYAGMTSSLPFAVILGTIASNGTGFLVNCGRFITARPYSGSVLLGTSSLAKFSVVFSALHALYPDAKYLIVLVQFSVLVNYKLNLAPVDQGINMTFSLIGNRIVEPFGPEKKAVTPTEKKSVKEDKKKK